MLEYIVINVWVYLSSDIAYTQVMHTDSFYPQSLLSHSLH